MVEGTKIRALHCGNLNSDGGTEKEAFGEGNKQPRQRQRVAFSTV